MRGVPTLVHHSPFAAVVALAACLWLWLAPGPAAEPSAVDGFWNEQFRLPGVEDPLLLDLLREGELDEDAVDGVVLVQAIEDLHQLVLGRRGREDVELAAHADLVRGLLLVARVDLARGVLADEDGGEAGHDAVPVLEGADTLGDFRPQPRRSRVAVDNARVSHIAP